MFWEMGKCRFNTQPPEGGWTLCFIDHAFCNSFNTQPPEGGWVHKPSLQQYPESFNTQPPEGGWVISSNW